MAESIIELDVSTPWEPDEAPVRLTHRWRRLRWPAAAVVLVVAGAVLVAARPQRDLAPAYVLDPQILSLTAGGGRFVVTRYQGGGPAALETLDARDGRVLWRRVMHDGESIVDVTAQVVLIESFTASGADGQFGDGTLTALDAATGDVRWTRMHTDMLGLGAGLVIAEDQAFSDARNGFDPAYGQPGDGTNVPPLPHHERHLGLAPDSGRVVWSADTPPGAVLGVTMTDYPTVGQLSELNGQGELLVRDVGRGTVSATYHLQFSGTVARHAQGTAGQEVVWPAGPAGADIYDRTSGRRLWHWPGPGGDTGPYPCLPGKYCVFGDRRTDVLDAATGAALWHVDGFTSMLGADAERLVMSRQLHDDFRPDDLAAFAADGGAPRWRSIGWLLSGRDIFSMRPGGYYVWRPTENIGAVIGRLDPGTGKVELLGEADEFYGNPECHPTGGRLACLVNGTVYVWRDA